MDSPNPEKYPYDFDSLTKGSKITVPELQAILRASVKERRFATLRMRLVTRIRRALEARGCGDWTVAIRREEIHVLTDAEASVHNARLIIHSRRKARRGVRQLTAVDRGALTHPECSAHEERVKHSANVLSRMVGLSRKLPGPSPHRESVPQLPKMNQIPAPERVDSEPQEVEVLDA